MNNIYNIFLNKSFINFNDLFSDVLPKTLKAYPHVQEFLPDCTDFSLQCLQIRPNDSLPLDLPALKWSEKY